MIKPTCQGTNLKGFTLIEASQSWAETLQRAMPVQITPMRYATLVWWG
jgi:hypothetical protein